MCDVTDATATTRLIETIDPHEIYNLAGYSFPPDSIREPGRAFEVNTLGALNVLEGVKRIHQSGTPVRVYQASTMEIEPRASASNSASKEELALSRS